MTINNNQEILKNTEKIKNLLAAAATMAERSINGWTTWNDSDCKTLDENVRKSEV